MRRSFIEAGLGDLSDKVETGARLSAEDGVRLYRHADLHAVGALADRVRRRLHGHRAYYGINRHLDYTNVCTARCALCAFSRDAGAAGAFAHSVEELAAMARAAAEKGCTGIHMVGGGNLSGSGDCLCYALDLGETGKDNDYGSGRIQCYETISAMKTTPVKLKSFTARATPAGVRVRWATGSEKALAGFNLYRRPVSEAGDSASLSSFEKLNPSLIKGQSPYVYDDEGVRDGTRYEYLLEDVDLLGRTHTHGPVLVRAGGDALPVTYWLGQSAPNPARGRATVKFGLAEGFAGRAVVNVYDLSGRRVSTPVDGRFDAGVYEAAIDTAALAPGVYVYRLSAGTFSAAKRMVVVR